MPLETLIHCPICNSSSFKDYLSVEDYTVSNREFTIQRCNNCQFIFTNPRPDQQSIGEYYESKEYISHHDENSSLMTKVYNKVRDYTIHRKVKMIAALQPSKGTLLDIGCGTGNFLQACKKDGWNASGTEPDSGARSRASDKVGDTIHQNIHSPLLVNQTFNIITMWHVLEHVHQLNETISWARLHLATHGNLIIAVPNPESYDAHKYGKFWAAYDVPRHLYHFTKTSMKTLLEPHGLHIDSIKPMWFDSFYVSMLSSKYKSKSINLIESTTTGLISNLKAKPNDMQSINTSSLIYIISKQ